MTSSAKVSWREKAKRLGLDAFVSFVVSGVVAAVATAYFESRLINSEERVHEITAMQQKIGSAQNNFVGRFAVYAVNLYDKKSVDAATRDELLKSILDIELQLHSLKERIPKKGSDSIVQYTTELDNFQKTLRTVRSPLDLKASYESFQKLLAVHSKLEEQIFADNSVSIF